MKKNKIKFEFVNKCPVCAYTIATEVLISVDRLIRRQERFPLMRCPNCGLHYLYMRPTRTHIENYYPDEYEPYNVNKRNFYIELQDMLMSSYFRKNKSVQDIIFGLIYQFIYGDFPIVKTKNPRVLDIGCGNGLLIHSLKKNGMDVYGVDMSRKSVDFAQKKLGLRNVKQEKIENIKYPNSQFDVIVMNHVLEHVYYPRGMFVKLSKFLKENGTIIITTPNTSAVNFSIFGKDWFPLETPRHLVLFNRTSVAKLSEISGLRIKKIVHDRSSHALLHSIKYKFGINISFLKIFLIPLSIYFSLLGRSDIVTYHIIKGTHKIK